MLSLLQGQYARRSGSPLLDAYTSTDACHSLPSTHLIVTTDSGCMDASPSDGFQPLLLSWTSPEHPTVDDDVRAPKCDRKHRHLACNVDQPFLAPDDPHE